MPNAQHPKAALFARQNLFAGISSFAELEARIAMLSDEQSRGAAFEVFAEAYLATQRKHDAAMVWPLPSVPARILQTLGIVVQDQGVDGVFETRLGNLNAYQVKFRTSRPALTWLELSTFMGLADSTHISSRVLLTNCDELPSVLNERRSFFCIRGSDFDRMEADDFHAIEAWLADTLFIPPKKQPQPHQKEALNALLPALLEYGRASAIMACGTGKTLVALWVAEKLQAQRILVLLPSLALLRQTLHEWLHETGLPGLAYLCVCSDPTVKEELDGATAQQCDLDFQVTTNSARVREFLDAPFTGVKVVFNTYQSAQVVSHALKQDEAFDFAVFDEAHKTAGREGRNYSIALDDKHLPVAKRLFLTATPRHYNPLSKDEGGDAKLVFSMDKPEVYGPQAYCLTFAEAARRGIICHYKVIISVITSKMVTNDLLNRGETLVNGDAVRARQVANQLALTDAIAKCGANKIFTFHSRVDAAASFTAKGNEGVSTHLPEFKSFHVNGEMPTALRERVMRDFRASARAIMSNARCLTEGVDVPAVDMVAFMSPRKSKIDIVQATGRAMRSAPGKTTGFVLVPLYVEQAGGETIEQAIQRTEFDEVWQVLQSLQEQDDVLAETISQLRESYGRGTGFDSAGFSAQVDIVGPSICLEVLRSAITTKCAYALASTWDERFGQLKAFQERTGHLHVDIDWQLTDHLNVDIDWQLKQWVRLQRRLERRGKLSSDRIRKLNEIGFDWNLTKGQRTWSIMLAKLRAFKRLHGHCDLKQQHAGQYVLQSWLDDQHRKFARNTLTSDRILELKELGIVFDPPESREQVLAKAWERMFEQLLAFKKKHGDCDVPRGYYGFEDLDSWGVCQRNLRAARKLKRGFIQRLDEVGFVWNTEEHRWRKTFSSCCESLSSGGVSGLEAAIQQDAALNRWVRSQQSAHKRRALSRQRQSLLNQVGFPWEFPKKPKESSKPAWEDTFAKLAEFYKSHGHCDMRLVHPINEYLHKWGQEQRRARQEGAIASEQICQLDQLGFIWDTDELLWERVFRILVAYKSAHGDCNVPPYWRQDLRLAVWVASQRKRRRLGELKPEQVNKLEQIGFAWDAK